MASELVNDCPRCGAKHVTFDVLADIQLDRLDYNWVRWYEAFAKCRQCHRSVIFVLRQQEFEASEFLEKSSPSAWPGSTINAFMSVQGFINIGDVGARTPPDSVPEPIGEIFIEGAKSAALGCFNAAGTMFRLCLDIATRDRLPPDDGAPGRPNSKQRRDLGLRLPWLFDQRLLPEDLRDLASCVKEDGNDGAHAGTLTKEDAEDLADFAYAFLERIYTEPARLKDAADRRAARRGR